MRGLGQLRDTPQPFVQQAVGQRTQSLPRQVHQREGEIVEHVDVGDFFRELDGVERHRLARQHDDVAQVQIAMAAAHRAGRHAARHQVEIGFQRLGHGLGQRLAGRRIEPVSGLAHLAHVGRHRLTIVVGHAEARFDRREPVMETGDAGTERAHQFRRQGAALGHAIEHPVLVEPVHDDQPIDGSFGRFADFAQRQLAVAVSPHRCRAEIDLRRQPVVDLDLGGAHRGAPLDRREVHVREFHRALQLVRTLAGEEDHGAMRVDAPDRREVGLQEGDDLRLVLDNEGGLPAHGLRPRARAVRDRPSRRHAG